MNGKSIPTEKFAEREFVERYVRQGPLAFVPGFEAMHLMVAQLVAETTPKAGSVLILGAGGGHELTRLAAHDPSWEFCAVDPSPEMLAAARYRMDEQGNAGRVDWVEGLIDAAPDGPFDAATCLLTLHFVPDDGAKRETLRALRRRLKLGAQFVLVDLCMELGSDGFEEALERYVSFARASGAEPDDVAQVTARIRQGDLPMATQSRNEALFKEAGFSSIELFYAGFSWRGWSMKA